MLEITAACSALGLGAAAAYYGVQLQRPLAEHRLRAFCRRRRVLALTYDDGPGAHLTPRLLDLLGEHRAAATFFPLGVRAVHRRDLVERIAREGHEIGSHTSRHGHAWRELPWRSVNDLAAGYEQLNGWADRSALYRPPHGKLNLAQWVALRRRGAGLGWWTIDSGDTRDRLPPVRDTVARIRRAGGGIVLMHDHDRQRERESYVLELTRRLLELAATRCWRIRRCSEVLRAATGDGPAAAGGDADSTAPAAPTDPNRMDT